jgi:ribosome biogenesis GTPase
MLTGTVLAQEANFYRVRLGREDPGRILLCTRRARLKKTGQTVYTGDTVSLTEVDWQGGRAAIADILPRRSLLARPPIANCTAVLVVAALSEPPYDPVLMSRFLVCVATEGLPAHICLTKRDEVDAETVEATLRQVRGWGYPATAVSAASAAGINELVSVLAGGVWVLAGASGSGKSSLINALKPGLDLRVGEISDRLGRGRHTTRHVELFELPGPALVADAPGFNQLELTFPPDALDEYFPEFRPLSASCQFRDCLHREEPGCAVRSANLERYAIYRTFLEETLVYEQKRRARSEPDAVLKSVGRRRIPRLDGQYRQTSRRLSRQQLDQWNGEGAEED